MSLNTLNGATTGTATLEELQEAMKKSTRGRGGPPWEDREWKGGETAQQMVIRLAAAGYSYDGAVLAMDATGKWTKASVRTQARKYWEKALKLAGRDNQPVKKVESPVVPQKEKPSAEEVPVKQGRYKHRGPYKPRKARVESDCSSVPGVQLSVILTAKEFVDKCGGIEQARGALDALVMLQVV